MKTSTFTFLMLSLWISTSAQTYNATQQYFGASDNDGIRRISKISDNEFLLIGTRNRTTDAGGYAEMIAIKTQASLTSTQSYRLNSDERDIGDAALVFSDGTFGMVGITTNNAATATADETVFARFQENGSVMTFKSWGDNTTDPVQEAVIRHAAVDPDDNVIIVGYTNLPLKPLIKKVTPEGFDVWSYELEQGADAAFVDIHVTDEAYYCTGWTKQSGDERIPLLVKIDYAGNLVWSRVYNFTDENTPDLGEFREILLNNSGELLIAFRYQNEDSGLNHTGIAKVDVDGNLIWNKQLNFGTDHNSIYGLVKGISENEYVCVGSTFSLEPGNSDATIFSFNDSENGPTTNWIRVFPGSEDDRFFDVESFQDGENVGYMAVGETQTFSSGGWDGWIVRTDQFGGGWENSECWMPNLPFSFQDIAMTPADANASLSSWNIISNQDLTFDQPIISPLNNDELCEPLPLATSLAEIQSDLDATSVYPNPSNGQFFVQSEREISEAIDIEVRSVHGQIVYRSGTQNIHNRIEINLRDCTPGLYLVILSSEKGAKTTRKILVQ